MSDEELTVGRGGVGSRHGKKGNRSGWGWVVDTGRRECGLGWDVEAGGTGTGQKRTVETDRGDQDREG